MTARGKGICVTWIRDHVAHQDDDCLIWPFSRNPINGYGHFGHERKHYLAHRFMCKLAHGEPPTPKHQAAHSCGKGRDGCINPRHLSWKTHSQNQLDRRLHGTKHNAWWGKKGKLKPQQVLAIRALKGQLTQAAIARDFMTTESNVRAIQNGKTWRHLVAAEA